MFSIDNNDIYLTRGDTLLLTLTLVDIDGRPYEPQEGDSARFAMKKRFKDENCLILKNIPMDTMMLVIEPADTKQLAFGNYVYDIEYTDVDGRVSTVIIGDFIITKEVY